MRLDFGCQPAASCLVVSVGRERNSAEVAFGFAGLEGTSGFVEFGQPFGLEDRPGCAEIVGFVGLQESVASVEETGTIVGDTACSEIRRNFGFRLPHRFSVVRSSFLSKIFLFFARLFVAQIYFLGSGQTFSLGFGHYHFLD